LVEEYERRFAEAVGIPHGVAVSYARIGIRAILQALGLRPGDEVILSPLTCKVVPLALLSLDLKPIYADISADTLNLDPTAVEAATGPQTRAILFQHTYGSSAGVDGITAFANRRKIPMVEDCAQCLPSGPGGPGTWGSAAVFSNNLRKPLPAGAGGLAVMSDARLAAEVRSARDGLRSRGSISKFLMRVEAMAHEYLLRPGTYWLLLGLKKRLGMFYKARPLDAEIRTEITDCAFRVSDHQAQEGSRWVASLDKHVAGRREHVRAFAQELSAMASFEIPVVDEQTPLYYFPIRSESKDQILTRARELRIELIAWPIGLPIYPIENRDELAQYGYAMGSCPVAEKVAQTLMGIPTDHFTTTAHRNALLAMLREVDA
jgi:dTDP-4-amino-4,6-dideoxygalactose transaminase